MNTEQDNKDLLQKLFSQMEEEKLPDTFRADVMKQVLLETARIKKRNEFLGLLSVILASIAIVAMALVVLCPPPSSPIWQEDMN